MRRKPARYRLVSHPDVPNDSTALSRYGAIAVSAARAALDDLAHGRVTLAVGRIHTREAPGGGEEQDERSPQPMAIMSAVLTRNSPRAAEDA